MVIYNFVRLSRSPMLVFDGERRWGFPSFSDRYVGSIWSGLFRTNFTNDSIYVIQDVIKIARLTIIILLDLVSTAFFHK